MVLEKLLTRELLGCNAKTMLEIGCGNSIWLPYYAKHFGLKVTGVDYVESACEQARAKLNSYGVSGTILCRDIFQASAEEIGQYDLVFSQGVVEHFSDIDGTIKKFIEFVRPGGVLFTEIPNFPSFHSVLVKFWQPTVWAKHNMAAKRSLVPAYQSCGMNAIRHGCAGIFSLNLTAWGVEPRFPRLEKFCMPGIGFVRRATNRVCCGIGRYNPILDWLAPFYYVAGNKGPEFRAV
jgi:SAM-dependent methyltransferase